MFVIPKYTSEKRHYSLPSSALLNSLKERSETLHQRNTHRVYKQNKVLLVTSSTNKIPLLVSTCVLQCRLGEFITSTAAVCSKKGWSACNRVVSVQRMFFRSGAFQEGYMSMKEKTTKAVRWKWVSVVISSYKKSSRDPPLLKTQRL